VIGGARLPHVRRIIAEKRTSATSGLSLGLRDRRLVRRSLVIPPAELVGGSVVGAAVYRGFRPSDFHDELERIQEQKR
jgi:hypothetical protein